MRVWSWKMKGNSVVHPPALEAEHIAADVCHHGPGRSRPRRVFPLTAIVLDIMRRGWTA